MPSRTRGGFYTPEKMKQLERIPLPDKIKCERCGKYKSQKYYSNKQLADARSVIQTKGQGASFSIKCESCAGSKQIVEIECTTCHKTKGLDSFAKSQRNKIDEAECYACVDDRLAQDAVDEEVYAGESRDKAFVPGKYDFQPGFDSSSTVCGSSATSREWKESDGGVSLSSGFAEKLTFKENDQESLIETEYENGSQTDDDGGWQTVSSKSWHSSTNKSNSTAKFNRNAYGKPGTVSSSSSVLGTSRTWNSSYVERSNQSSKSKWAKIRAYDPKRDGENPYSAQSYESDEEEEDEQQLDDGLGDEYDSD